MCAVLSKDEYRAISRRLKKIDDIAHLSEKYGIDYETLLIIFHQKEVRRIIRLHGKVMARRMELLEEWENGRSILQLAEKENFSPVLMVQIILAAMNVSKKRTKKITKNPEIVEDERLKREIREAMAADNLYSPKAHEEQRRRGEEGERKLFTWLDSMGIEYVKEEEMSGVKGKKTPDALLKEPITLHGRRIIWMDSKASFGDPEEIERAYKRQFKHYIELFGPGAVIYWYGYVKTEFPEGLLVLDSLPGSR